MYHRRTYASMLANARELHTDKLARYINELPAGHSCGNCWRCACRAAYRERMQTGHLLVNATKETK